MSELACGGTLCRVVKKYWSSLRDSLRGNASEAVWAAGLSTLRLVDYHDNELVIGAPNQIQLLRVQQRYLPFITEQAEQLVGRPVTVSLTITDAGSDLMLRSLTSSAEVAGPRRPCPRRLCPQRRPTRST